jgi:hypothetical protein
MDKLLTFVLVAFVLICSARAALTPEPPRVAPATNEVKHGPQ